MSKSTVIIRLIDIVLILLFGFLVISEINKKSPIRLPQSRIPIEKKIDEEELFIVGINEDKRLYIENEDRYVSDLEILKGIIQNRNEYYESRGKKLRVRIRSFWNIPIKHTMRIAQYCQRLNISVGMDVHSVQ
ncbi:hypothetical protein GF337_11785 [candidate division KSB1 bacterium]|nr:hypothetical protein [candidate division KSB1 bacterium]